MAKSYRLISEAALVGLTQFLRSQCNSVSDSLAVILAVKCGQRPNTNKVVISANLLHVIVI
jgi:hypothetical protein